MSVNVHCDLNRMVPHKIPYAKSFLQNVHVTINLRILHLHLRYEILFPNAPQSQGNGFHSAFRLRSLISSDVFADYRVMIHRWEESTIGGMILGEMEARHLLASKKD